DLKVSEVPLATLNGAKGYFQPSTNEIVIGGDEPDNALKLKTLYHEYAHSQLHGLKSAFKDRPRAYQETQAEAVAYVAMQNIGVDTGNYSLGYVATWAKDKAVIHSALSEIQQVSNKVIELSDGLTEKLGLQQEKANKITEKIEDIAKEKLVVKADNPVEAVQKLYNNDLESAIQDSFTLSDVSEKEAQHFLKTVKWEDVADIEKSNNAIKDLGHGYYADEYIERNDNNPHSANQSILKNNDPEHPTLSQQYKNLLKQVQDPAKNNQQAEKQLKQVHQEISNRTQNQLKDFAKHNPEVKQPEKEETQQIRR
ncbi:LtrC, partial [Lactiplantibacillus plantarum]|uniref:LtrC n=1 Tax=Lactiplantibacillus plantarum TaxID=1590 RepID=UPI0025B2AE1E